MSYNGSGTFNINTAGQPVVTGTVISSTAFNALTADLGTGLSTAITKNGQTTVTANIPFNGYKLTGIAVATASGDALSYGQAATVSALTDSALTSGRVPYASTAGLFVDSANLTFNGTTLTANTIGAFTLGGTVAGGGNQLNNVIIGTTTPLAGAFTTLSATTTITQGSGASGLILQSHPSVYGAIYSTNVTPSATNYTLVTNGSFLQINGSANVNLMVANSSIANATSTGLAVTGALSNTTGANFATSSGSVGIGTSSPAALLDVNGFMRSIALGTPPASGAGLELFYTSSTGYVQAYNRGTSAYNALFLSGSTVSTLIGGATAMIVDASGNLGLGVTPSAWSGGWKAYQVGVASLACYDPNNDTRLSSNNYETSVGSKYIESDFASMFRQSQGQHQWYNAPSGTAGNAITFTQAMTLDASGNLMVGTTTANGKISLYGTTASTATSIDGTGRYKAFELYDSGVRKAYFNNDQTNTITSLNTAYGTLTFGTGDTERARIDTSGNLLVGTTNTNPVGNRVNGNFVNAVGGLNIRGATGNTALGLNATSGTHIAFYTDNGSAAVSAGTITSNGSATLYNATSDYRLKTVINSVADSGSRIDALKPVDYQWKDGNLQARGFLAHEFQTVYPNSVTGDKDAIDTDGKPVYQAMQAGSAEVIADLVAELQSLRARVAQLETKGV